MCPRAGKLGLPSPPPRPPGGGPGWDWGGPSEGLEAYPGGGAAESPGGGGALGTPSCLVVGGWDSRGRGAPVANFAGASPQTVADLRHAFHQGLHLGSEELGRIWGNL